MSVLTLPRTVKLRLEQIQRDFLWGGGALERKTSSCKMGVSLLRQKKRGFGGEVSFFS